MRQTSRQGASGKAELLTSWLPRSREKEGKRGRWGVRKERKGLGRKYALQRPVPSDLLPSNRPNFQKVAPAPTSASGWQPSL